MIALPMAQHAEEILEGEHRTFDDIVDNVGQYVIRHRQHDPQQNTVLGEDLDAEIQRQE